MRTPIRAEAYRGPTVPGIDVSRYQRDVDYGRVADAGYRYVYVRSGDGLQTRPHSVLDPEAGAHSRGVRDAGLRLGWYHYLRAWYSGEEQAELLLRAWDLAGGPQPGDLAPAADVEGSRTTLDLRRRGIYWTPDGSSPPSSEQAADCAQAFVWRLERELGVRPLIYTRVTWHWGLSQREIAGWAADYPLWVPDYTSRPRLPSRGRGLGRERWPWDTWTIWQTSGSDEVPGVGTCDRNVYRGTEAELDDELGIC